MSASVLLPPRQGALPGTAPLSVPRGQSATIWRSLACERPHNALVRMSSPRQVGKMDGSRPHPERIGQYEIVKTLRLGSMWRTYKGVDPILRRNVALKAVSKELLSSRDSAGMARLQNEAGAAASLKHPGVVRVFGYDEDAGLAFVVMEYVEGRSLKERFQAPVGDAVALMVQLLEALSYAHDQGVVHRALKPSNLMLTSEGQLRVADFGVPRLDASPTNYMSPEQFIRAQVDRRSDIFSAGVIFYELLTGVNPFAGPAQDLINRVCNDKEGPPSEINSKVPSGFDPVCAKALAKVVHDRYLTARAFSDAVRSAFEAAFGTAPSKLISPETVIAGTAQPEDQSAAGPGSEPAGLSGGGSRWDDGTLQEVEKRLAAFIGPVAGVIVQKAASTATDLNQIYTLAAQSLEREEERRAFLAGRLATAPSPAPRPPEVSLQIPKQDLPVKAMPIGRDPTSEPKPAPKPPPRPEPSPARPDLKSGPRPAFQPEAKSSAEPGSKPSLESTPKPEPNAEVKPRPAPPQSPPPEKTDRLEELLGKQPETLAGYLKDSPAQVETVIHAFVATVEGLAATYAASAKIEPLTPQSISFDRIGKATIRAARPITHGTGGVVNNPRYAAPEVFAEKGGAESTTAGADVYALGAMFYEILLGRTLFSKSFGELQSDLDWLSWHADLERKAPPLKSLLPDCPAALSDLLESMMEKHAEKRTTDVQTILQRLRSVAQRANRTVVLSRPAAPRRTTASPGTKVAPEPVKVPISTSSRQRKKGGKRLALVLLLLVLIVCGVLVWLEPGLYRELVIRLHQLTQTP